MNEAATIIGAVAAILTVGMAVMGVLVGVLNTKFREDMRNTFVTKEELEHLSEIRTLFQKENERRLDNLERNHD